MRETDGGIDESPLRYTCIRRYGIREPACETYVCQRPRPSQAEATHVDGGGNFSQVDEYSDQLIRG